MCGVFWFIPSDQGPKIVADGSTLREAEDYGKMKTHRRDHYEVWEIIKNHFTIVAEDEYDTWPRGRIVYNKTTEVFTVYAGPQLAGPQFQRAILNAFRLPPDTKFARDEHAHSRA
jgi:hypothetical protein